MDKDVVRHNRRISDHLHPLVYAAMVGLALWLVVSVWGFAADGYTDYLLVVVSGFIVVALVIPSIAWRISRRREPASGKGGDMSFRDWASGEFVTGQGSRKAASAAVEILLPIAAVAFGMTAFAIVLHLSGGTLS